LDNEERYKVAKSINDAIVILDSAPVRPDMMPVTNIIQISNRVLIAHLAIGRGLKALIVQAGGKNNGKHALLQQFKLLKKNDPQSADRLQSAFQDAIAHYGFDVTQKDFVHSRTIEDYFAKVAGEEAVQSYGYWPVEDYSKGATYFPFV